MPAQGCKLPINSYRTEVFKCRQSGVHGCQFWRVNCPCKEGLWIITVNGSGSMIDDACKVPSHHDVQP